MKHTFCNRIFILSLLFMACFALQAKSPKIGLVLSGGGAKGVAEAGVIKALEERGITFQYVTGTSMGSIVGSLYACGISPDEMIALFESNSFLDWSRGIIRPKQYWDIARPAPSSEWFEVGLSRAEDGKIKIVNNLISGSLISPLPMNIEFIKLYGQYTRACKGDFNQLFVPLRTITSDIYHKRKIICRDGDLSRAVRASMSFPMVYKPIQMDGVLVYDGGIYDNFPVDVMQEEFNPDFIVGVSVAKADKKPVQDNLYSQLEDMIIQNNDYSLPENAGVKIQVPVSQFSVLEFDKAREIYEIGYKTGVEMADSIIARLENSARFDWTPDFNIDERRESYKDNLPEFAVEDISVSGSDSDPYFNSFFPKERPLTMSDLSKGYYHAISTGSFSDLLPVYIQRGDSTIIDFKPTYMGRFRFGIGGWATTSRQSHIYLGMGWHPLKVNPSGLTIEGWLGQAFQGAKAAGRYYLPSSPESYLGIAFTAARRMQLEKEAFFFEDYTGNYARSTDLFASLRYAIGLGRQYVGYAEISSAHLGRKYINREHGANLTHNNDYQTFRLKAAIESNTFNNLMYPSRGMKLSAHIAADATRLLGTHGYHKTAEIQALWNKYYPLSRHFSIGLYAQGRALFGNLYQSKAATLLLTPEFSPTPAMHNYYNTGFLAPSYIAAGVTPVWMPIENFQVRADCYLYSWARGLNDNDAGIATYDGWFNRYEIAAEMNVVYNLPFASLSVYCTYLSSPARNWNIGINFGVFLPYPTFM